VTGRSPNAASESDTGVAGQMCLTAGRCVGSSNVSRNVRTLAARPQTALRTEADGLGEPS